MATAEDIFEGAIGIDLGTTYSYVPPSLNLSLQ
jgi:molecular chaperone DnaK (HSP70)